jgi:hypothetical protein
VRGVLGGVLGKRGKCGEAAVVMWACSGCWGGSYALLVVGGSGDSAAGHSRGQGGLGKKSGPVAVIWVTVEARR